MYESKNLLDKRREGQEFSLADINRALRDAGDLSEERSERMDTSIPIESKRDWKTASTSLVVGSERSDKKEAWAGWSRYLDCRDAEVSQ